MLKGGGEKWVIDFAHYPEKKGSAQGISHLPIFSPCFHAITVVKPKPIPECDLAFCEAKTMF